MTAPPVRPGQRSQPVVPRVFRSQGSITPSWAAHGQRGLKVSPPGRILDGSHKQPPVFFYRRREDRSRDQVGSEPRWGDSGTRTDRRRWWLGAGPAGEGCLPPVFAFSTPRGMGNEQPKQDAGRVLKRVPSAPRAMTESLVGARRVRPCPSFSAPCLEVQRCRSRARLSPMMASISDRLRLIPSGPCRVRVSMMRSWL